MDVDRNHLQQTRNKKFSGGWRCRSMPSTQRRQEYLFPLEKPHVNETSYIMASDSDGRWLRPELLRQKRSTPSHVYRRLHVALHFPGPFRRSSRETTALEPAMG